MPTNRECVVATLASHRQAGQWTDESVADDLVAQLGLRPDADAKNAKPIVDPSLMSEDEVIAAEAQAKEVSDKAKAARATFDAQRRDAQQAEREASRSQSQR